MCQSQVSQGSGRRSSDDRHRTHTKRKRAGPVAVQPYSVLIWILHFAFVACGLRIQIKISNEIRRASPARASPTRDGRSPWTITMHQLQAQGVRSHLLPTCVHRPGSCSWQEATSDLARIPATQDQSDHEYVIYHDKLTGFVFIFMRARGSVYSYS